MEMEKNYEDMDPYSLLIAYASGNEFEDKDKEPVVLTIAGEEVDADPAVAKEVVDKEPVVSTIARDEEKEDKEETNKRRNPSWIDPSYKWGNGKYLVDGRKKFKKNVDKENDAIPPVKETVETKKKKKESDEILHLRKTIAQKKKNKESEEIPPHKEIIEKINETGEIHLRKEATEKDKESDAIGTHGGCSGSGVSELSIEELMQEYNSLPPQIPEWFWCIEYVAKFHKDLRSILDLMNMGYPCRNDYGKRINEILSLRILEFMFHDPKGKNVVDDTQPRIEFDLSLSNVDVLNTIIKEIPVSELRRGMPELSKFNVLPFIAHKNKNLPQCALEKMKDLGLLEKKNQTSEPPPSMEANDSVLRDDRSAQHVKPRDEEEEQVNIGLKEMNIDKDKVIIIDDSDDDEEDDDPMETNEKDEVIVINDDDNHTTNDKTDASRDGAWLIDDDDDDDDDDDESDHHMVTKGSNIASRLRSKKKNVCRKCKNRGRTLLICSRSDCGEKVHKECMKNFEVNYDEFGNFLCPVCWFHRSVEDYNVCLKIQSVAKARLVKFLPLLTKARKRCIAPQNAGIRE